MASRMRVSGERNSCDALASKDFCEAHREASYLVVAFHLDAGRQVLIAECIHAALQTLKAFDESRNQGIGTQADYNCNQQGADDLLCGGYIHFKPSMQNQPFLFWKRNGQRTR
jgi:hypothetical protein